jgi:outer membrane protein, heavy metal efflux system
MKRIICLLMIGGLGVSSLPGANLPDHPITLKEAMDLLAKQSPLLASAKAHTLAVRSNEVTAGLRPNPIFTSANEDFAIFNTHQFDLRGNQEFTQNVSQLIERGHKRQLRVEDARWVAKVTQDTYADTERQLQYAVKSAFVNMLLAKSNLQLAQDNLHDYQETVKLNEVRMQAGDISPTDFARIRVEEARFQDDLLNAQESLAEARIQLGNLLGFENVPESFDVEGKLEAPEITAPLPELQALAAQHRPDYVAARDSVSEAQSAVKLADANGATDVAVGGEYKRNQIENTVGFTVQLPLRIFDRNQGEKARTRGELIATQDAEMAAKYQVNSDVAQAYAAYQSSAARARIYNQQYLKQAQEVRDRIEFSYRQGGSSLLDYLDAVRTYRDTELAWRRAYAQVMLSVHQLSLATGTELQP